MAVARIERLREEHLSSGFRSGVKDLDAFFARHALPNDKRGISATWVFLRDRDDPPAWPQVLGYYTLALSTVDRSQVASIIGEDLPRYPLSAALLGRLAVDARARGRGLGEALLWDALRRILRSDLPCVGVVTDAKDATAASFYVKYGFVLLTDDQAPWPRRHFLARATIEQAFREAEREQIGLFEAAEE